MAVWESERSTSLAPGAVIRDAEGSLEVMLTSDPNTTSQQFQSTYVAEGHRADAVLLSRAELTSYGGTPSDNEAFAEVMLTAKPTNGLGANPAALVRWRVTVDGSAKANANLVTIDMKVDGAYGDGITPFAPIMKWSGWPVFAGANAVTVTNPGNGPVAGLSIKKWIKINLDGVDGYLPWYST